MLETNLVKLRKWRASGGTVVKNLSYKGRDTEDARFCLCQEDPPEEEMATRSIFLLPGRTLWTEEPGKGQQFTCSLKELILDE